jgi:transcriptional regulator with XRE-family HTH domain
MQTVANPANKTSDGGADALRRRLRAAGISDQAVAAACGFTRQAVWQQLAGRRRLSPAVANAASDLIASAVLHSLHAALANMLQEREASRERLQAGDDAGIVG